MFLGGHPGVKKLVIIDNLDSQPVMRWNEEHTNQKIAVGYVVTEVNGITEIQEMIKKNSWSHINQNSDEDGPVSKTVACPRSSLEIRSKNILMQQNLTMSTEACHCGKLCSISYVRIDGTAEAQLPCGHRFYRACMTK